MKKIFIYISIIFTLLIGSIFAFSKHEPAKKPFVINNITCYEDIKCFPTFIDKIEKREDFEEVMLKVIDWDVDKAPQVFRLFMNNDRFKNDCYALLENVGKKVAMKYGEAVYKEPLTICRSMYDLGIILGLKDKISTDKAKELIGHLCDEDPEKNGCTDGVGKLAYLYGFSSKEAVGLCEVGEKGVSLDETYFEGCMGGFGNWSRYGSFWAEYSSISDVKDKYCLGVKSKGLPSCLGYGMRSYVRYGLADNTYQGRLDEFYNICKNDISIRNFCGVYLGFVLADVYNDKFSDNPVFKGKELAKKVDRYCNLEVRIDCYSSFVAWYINQWAFSSGDGEFAKKDTLEVCSYLKDEVNIALCRERVRAEEERYNKRLANVAKE